MGSWQKGSLTNRNGLKHPAGVNLLFVSTVTISQYSVLLILILTWQTRVTTGGEWHHEHMTWSPGTWSRCRGECGHQSSGRRCWASSPRRGSALPKIQALRNNINEIVYLQYLVQILSNKCLFARPGLLVQQNIFSFMIGILIFGPLLIKTFSIK